MITGNARTLSGLQLGRPRTLTVIESGQGGPIGTLPGSRNQQYVHAQALAQSVWDVPHNLGRRPAAVSLFSNDYGVQYGQYVVQHLDENNLRVVMDTPTDGVAICE